MADLVEFYGALQEDHQEGIQAYLDALDRESANKRLEAMGEHYQFKTFWHPEAFDGWRVMLGQDLANVMHGTRDVRGLGQLLRRYDADLIDVRASQHDVATLRRHFSLAKTVSQVKFATWAHFLLAGMKGETPAARKVGAYLLAMERHGRIQEEHAILQQPLDPIEILRQGVLKTDGRVTTLETTVDHLAKDQAATKNNVISITRRLGDKDTHDKQRDAEVAALTRRMAHIDKLEQRAGQVPIPGDTTPRDLPPSGWLHLYEYLRQVDFPGLAHPSDADCKKLHKLIKKYQHPYKWIPVGGQREHNYYDPTNLKKACNEFLRLKAFQVPLPKSYTPYPSFEFMKDRH